MKVCVLCFVCDDAAVDAGHKSPRSKGKGKEREGEGAR